MIRSYTFTLSPHNTGYVQFSGIILNSNYMKRIALFLTFTIASFIVIKAQVPQGFNYQAVARNASGGLITNTPLPVRITIKSDSLGGTIFWQELHSSVTTGNLGVINLVLGKGTRQSVSTIATFNAIDWSVTPKFLKTEIDYSGWITMGVSRLWSVPYSMIAGDLAGSVKKLAVEGETSGLEEALFEVKNKDGQTVFAVYNEGVRVYVSNGAKAVKGGFAVGGFGTDKAGESTKYLMVSKDSVRIYLDTNPLTKKQKGGFAVGGYDLTKGTVQNYLDVNSDSVRIYIDSDPSTKKLKGGFAVGGYDMTKNSKTNYMNVNTDASGIINPSQNRILWYPLKNAFLTGKVLIQNKDSVGENSFSSGYESKAKGMYSQALGYKAIARGDYSTAIGKNAVANNINSFAFGDGANVKKNDSYSFGAGAIASGIGSYAIGSAGRDTAGNLNGLMTSASGDYSFALGQGSNAKGRLAFAMGSNVIAEGKLSTAMGYYTTAIGDESIAMGSFTTTSGYQSVAIGGAQATENYSYAVGLGAKATATSSISLGLSTKASGIYSTALGAMTTASAYGSNAMGYYTTANGYAATAMGDHTAASNSRSTAMGYNTVASGAISTATGSMTAAIGSVTTAMGYKSIASGDNSTAIGVETKAIGIGSTSLGRITQAVGWYSTATGNYTKAKPFASFVAGQYNDTTCNINGINWWQPTDPLLIVGNGTANNARSNAFTVLKNGNTAIGHASPTQMLDVNGNARFRSIGSGAYVGAVNRTSDGTLTTATSDKRSKNNISTLTNSLNAILNLRGISFTWINEPELGKRIGFIAQEVEPVLPELVFTNPADGLKGVNYAEMTAVLVEAMKEQQQQIESCKSENNNLKSQLQILQEEVGQIKALVNILMVNQTEQIIN
jgi:hypothetical protein